MKIVDRKTFLSLPIGTVYSCYSFGDDGETIYPAIKVGNREVTWAYTHLLPDPKEEEHESSSYPWKQMETRLGKEYPSEEFSLWDSYYDQDQLFLIFNKREVYEMMYRLQKAITNMEEDE